MADVTRILTDIEQGDPNAAQELLPLVYGELRRLAEIRLQGELPGQTLQPTALVHEAYIRLVDQSAPPHWDSRAHFFSAAAEAMRRILVDRARRRLRAKHGGDRLRVELVDIAAAEDERSTQLLAVHESLDRLEAEDPVKAQLVKLRYFVGMSVEEAASALNISRATAVRYWTYVKAWLTAELGEEAE